MGDFSILWTVLGIGLLIFIHELGHFLAARMAGVRVEIFSLGFGPRLLGLRVGPTDYRLSAVPLGGFVKVAGDDPTERRFLEPDDLHAKGFLARALFFSGGVLMNLLFALIVFPLVFKSGVDFTAPVVGEVINGGAAWEADVRPGDRILAVDGKRMYSFENLSTEVALAGPDEIALEIERGGEERLEKIVRPRWAPGRGVYEIEITPPLQSVPPTVVLERRNRGRSPLRDGDLLLSIDGKPVDAATLDADLAALAKGEPRAIPLTVRRDGRELAVSVRSERREVGDWRIGVLGASQRVRALRPPARDTFDLRTGDRIVAVDGKPFYGPTFEDVLQGPEQLELTVRREGRTEPLRLVRVPGAAPRKALLESIALGSEGKETMLAPLPGSPGQAAGLEAGDVVTAIDGKPVREWADMQALVRASDGKPLAVAFTRAGEPRTLSVKPTREVLDPGFSVRSAVFLREVYRVDGLLPAVAAGFVASVDLVKQLYVTLKRLLTGDVAATNLGGIIQISVVTHEFAKSGWARFLYFLGLLSINLAFMNFLPIPVLDGGHMLLLVIERLKGSPVSAKTLGYAQIAGLVFLIALMLFVTFNDIRRHF